MEQIKHTHKQTHIHAHVYTHTFNHPVLLLNRASQATVRILPFILIRWGATGCPEQRNDWDRLCGLGINDEPLLEQNLELAKHSYTLHKSSVVGGITPPTAEVWKLVLWRRVINSLLACSLSDRDEIETKVPPASGPRSPATAGRCSLSQVLRLKPIVLQISSPFPRPASSGLFPCYVQKALMPHWSKN